MAKSRAWAHVVGHGKMHQCSLSLLGSPDNAFTEHSLLKSQGTGRGLLLCLFCSCSVVPLRGKVASFKKAGGTFGRQKYTVALVFLTYRVGGALYVEQQHKHVEA